MHPNQGPNHNLNMCPEKEWNPRPFGVWDQDSTQLSYQTRALNTYFKRQDLSIILMPNHTLIHFWDELRYT